MFVVSAACQTAGAAESKRARALWLKSWRTDNAVWRGVHLSVHNDEQVEQLGTQLTKLKAVGVNVLIVEVNYSYDFKSHPELRPSQFVTKERAQALAKDARQLDIRLIPQLNCLGHQSWSRVTAPLLTKYPQFDETPGQFPNNTNIYCRSWCPQNPDVNKVVFALIDELIEAFEADAFHVGMDEVFLIASEHCPRCKGGDPAKLFAKAVNDLHAHVVGKRKLEMLLWGDRLLDAKALGYSEWEAAKNGTQGAIDLVPKDIIVCDWHYGKQTSYPSVPLLMEKGFRVWPSGWQPLEASRAFSAFAKSQKGPRMLGYLCTTWGRVKIPDAAEWPPVMQVLKEWE
jgi:methylphosphotriester-DNA--protein-cysteine methyltransferase